MAKVIVAILWHQHQPYYVDPTRRTAIMPWVRLHAVKDYYGMARLLQQEPGVRVTINLVPSLLKQLNEWLDGSARDHLFEIASKPTDDLTEEEVLQLLDECFMLNWATMVSPSARYQELLVRRDMGRKPTEKVRRQFSSQDILDLVVLHNLAWIHPCADEKDATLAKLRRKGRNFSEQDKQFVLNKHVELMREVIPLHRALQDSGQVELCTSPFYHPILPLLCDLSAGREARPGTPLPRVQFRHPKDATEQVQRAVRFFNETFGGPPRGLWPSEGSVSKAIIPIVASAQIEWVATDEAILAGSLGEAITRDSHETVTRPDRLYRPWKITEGGQTITIVFRDRMLSDLIGFKYQWMPPADAVNDFLSRLHRLARLDSTQPLLVAVILDGENAWEYYPNTGVEFLRHLYRRLAEDHHVQTLPMSEAIRAAGEPSHLTTLKPGSWINGDFNTWVGHREKNQAWEYLARVRDFLKGKEQSGTVRAPQALAHAWEELYVAEGSDWFWWYGDDHSSGQDDQFDLLFRLHLQSVYRALGEEPPDFLNNAICQVQLRELYTEPRAFLRVTLDGRRSNYFEWVAAGHYDAEKDRAAMHRTTIRPLRHIYFGFDADTLFLRLDPEHEHWCEQAADLTAEVRFERDGFTADTRLHLTHLDRDTPTLTLVRGEYPHEQAEVLTSVASDQVMELSCPFVRLGVKEGDELAFVVLVFHKDELIQRAPENTTISIRVPSQDFEHIMWRV